MTQGKTGGGQKPRKRSIWEINKKDMASGTLPGSYCLENKTTLSHLPLDSAHCFKKCFFKVLTEGSKDRDKNAAKGKIRWMVEKYGSLVVQVLNKLKQFLRNEAWLLLWIILILKVGGERAGVKTPTYCTDCTQISNVRDQTSLNIYMSCPKQHDTSEGKISYLSDLHLYIWFSLSSPLPIRSNYLGGKFAYQVSHNTLNTKKAHYFTFRAFMFITD